MELRKRTVLSHILLGIFTYIGLNNRPLIYGRYLQLLSDPEIPIDLFGGVQIEKGVLKLMVP